MAIGGFNGTDPTPTIAQFQAYVTADKIHYFIGGGNGGGGRQLRHVIGDHHLGRVELHGRHGRQRDPLVVSPN